MHGQVEKKGLSEAARASAPYGVAVLTMNEEKALPGLLKSIPENIPISLTDSGSSDSTIEIARSHGATVMHHAFTGFGDQRNAAIKASDGGPVWQLHLDADERMTEELDHEIRAVLGSNPIEDCFEIASRLILNGRWIRRSSGHPVYQVRLVNRHRARFVNRGHGQEEAPGLKVGRLKNDYIHEAYINGLDKWLTKHVQYARRDVVYEQARPKTLSALKGLLGARTERRRALRDASRYLPFRPTAQYLRIILLNRGFLDGRQGFVYAKMLATYQGMKDILRKEIEADR